MGGGATERERERKKIRTKKHSTIDKLRRATAFIKDDDLDDALDVCGLDVLLAHMCLELHMCQEVLLQERRSCFRDWRHQPEVGKRLHVQQRPRHSCYRDLQSR